MRKPTAPCSLLFGVVHRLFDDVEIHERFAAEKVGFENFATARIFDEKIDRLFRRFQAHELAAGVVGAFVGKAVFAAQVAIVADVQAQRLDLVRFGRRDFHLFLKKQALPR